MRRPPEQVEVENSWMPSERVLAQAWLVGVMREQAGDDHDRKADEQDQPENRRQPRPPERAPPEALAEGPWRSL